MKFFVTILILISSNLAQAQVWIDTNTWSNDTEIDFQSWVRDEFPSDIFWRADNPYFGKEGHPFRTIKDNPYRGLQVDCADAVCAMRIIYSHARSLPFRMIGNSGAISNRSESFGRPGEVQTLRAFLLQIIQDCSTISLEKNTFLVATNKVASGDVYRFNYSADVLSAPEGRHVHIVKNVTSNGNIHFVWASLPGYPRPFAQKIGAPELAPMTALGGKLQLGGLGFRRFYQPQDFALSAKDMKAAQETRGRDDVGQAELLAASIASVAQRIEEEAVAKTNKVAMEIATKQGLSGDAAQKAANVRAKDLLPLARRKIAENLVSVEFATGMNRALRTGPEETLPEKVSRMLSNACNYAKDRAQNVVEGLAVRERLLMSDGRARCMSSEDDNYFSTPGRDKQMRRVFEEVYRVWWGDERAPGLSDAQKAAVPAVTRASINLIYPHKRDLDINAADPAMNAALYATCQIDYLTPEHTAVIYKNKKIPEIYQARRSMDLRQLWIRVVNQRLSFDPHDPIEQRWGELRDLYDRSKGYNCVEQKKTE